MEEKVMYGLLTVYRERGYYLSRLEQSDKAMKAYDIAFEKFPEDVRLLLGRSQAAAREFKPLEAFENAQAALKVDPTNMNARKVQAQAFFTMKNFEKSLVMNTRGYRKRKQPSYFKEGADICYETLEDCLGKRAGNVMLDFLPLIKRNLSAYQDEFEPVAKKHVSRIPSFKEEEKQSQKEVRKYQTISRILANKYLGPMAYDKAFLKDLLEDRRLESANKKANEELKSLVKETLDTLTERQEMLRAQRPYYSIKQAEKSESKRHTKFKQELLQRDREINQRTAQHMILKLENAANEDKMMTVIALADRMQKFLDSKSPHTLPDKNYFLDRLYKAVGIGYFRMHRLSYNMTEDQNRRRIAFLMGTLTERPRSYDSVRANFPYRFMNIKYQTEKLMARLDSCENNYMRCWLFYELARLFIKQKNFALAKLYSKKCQRQAAEINSHQWWLNATYVQVSGDMKQGNTNEVRLAVEEAYEYAKKLSSPERVRVFLEKCLELASEPVIADEVKINRAREKQILRVMDEGQAVETGILFKRIERLPYGRRFIVNPRKHEPLDMRSERKRYRQDGLTVIPGKEKGLPRVPRSEIRGLQNFDF